MNRKAMLFVLACWGILPSAMGRIWTDNTGRQIEAEILGVEGDHVVVRFNGNRVPLALSRLSPDDLKFVREWKDGQGAAAPADVASSTPAAGLTLCGTPLRAGGPVTLVGEPLSAAAAKAFSKSGDKPSQLKMAIALPAGFDPAKPQYVMWVSAAINNDKERKNGNTGAIGSYAKTATDAGWVVVAVDTELGNPRVQDNQRSPGVDLAVQQNAIEVLSRTWPGFKTWTFACCGFSGGSKSTFFRAGDLLVSDLNVVGMFLGGCNQNMTDEARLETRYHKAGLRKIKVFVSNGKSDPIATVAMATAVAAGVKTGGYGQVRLELWDGAHSLNRDEFKKALEWFREAPAKKGGL